MLDISFCKNYVLQFRTPYRGKCQDTAPIKTVSIVICFFQPIVSLLASETDCHGVLKFAFTALETRVVKFNIQKKLFPLHISSGLNL